jgi:hypothetical protein
MLPRQNRCQPTMGLCELCETRNAHMLRRALPGNVPDYGLRLYAWSLMDCSRSSYAMAHRAFGYSVFIEKVLSTLLQ